MSKWSTLFLFQVICNALWYITNQHTTINGAALRQKDVQPIPEVFDHFTGYNETKRKKLKGGQLTAGQLKSHSEALYGLLLKPVLNSSTAWAKAHDDIKALADCLRCYMVYLEHQTSTQNINHYLEHPVRTVAEHTTVDHRTKRGDVKQQYMQLDRAVVQAGLQNPVIFNEEEHLIVAFESNLQRHRFLQNLQLSVPVDIFRFCPGGSVATSICFVQTVETRSEPEMLTECTRMACKLKDIFREYHTRMQRKIFKDRLSNIASVLPSVADLIYKELCLDSSAAAHPDTQERLRLVFLGEEGLLADLRHLNPGRPSGRYDVFFEHLSKLVEEVTAADERRHNTCHLSEWISLSDLIQLAEKKCPENTPIPSKSLVRLQFSPKNPYAKTATSFTSKIDVQYKIQRRQLRLSHPDQHYCAALFKYMKEKAVELGNQCCTMVCCDDKAKVAFGEPGFAISTGVRGKQTIAPTSTTMIAGDHDMGKASLTPSVVLNVDAPENASESFVRGQVSVIVNDSVFQGSTPFRHAVALSKVVPLNDTKILLKYSDGGTDHRTTLEAVRCAAICIFKEYNLDMLILARCAPGHSWQNPAERIMSILNLGLQNCSLERKQSEEKFEDVLKRCGSMKEIREKASKITGLKDAWIESVEQIQSIIRNRFARLKLKDKPFITADPVGEDEIDLLKRHLRELFPDLNLDKLQKVYTKKSASYQNWTKAHCRERQYSYQIRKCDDPSCCIPATSSPDQLAWLPDPVLGEDKEHFLKFNEVKGMVTTEDDRPTLKKTEKPKTTYAKPKAVVQPTPAIDSTELQVSTETAPEPTASVENHAIYTSQHARSTIPCIECRKPRIIYGMVRPSQRQKVALAMLFSEFDYTCGAPLTPPDNPLHGKLVCRPSLSCSSPVETPFYGQNELTNPKDICAHCGIQGASVDMDLRKRYKTVLPICEDCISSGKTAIVYRPYGKKK